MSLILFTPPGHSHRLPLIPNLRGRIWHTRQIKWTGCPYFGRATLQKLFEDCNGTSVISSCKHFWKEASGLCGQSGLACFCGVFDKFDKNCFSLYFAKKGKSLGTDKDSQYEAAFQELAEDLTPE